MSCRNLPLLLLAACSSAHEPQRSNTETEAKEAADATAEEAVAPSAIKAPGIPAGAAPDLAFEYSLAFKLPYDKIDAVQEEHVEACETLGSARCQIVDMTYQQITKDRAQGMLAFKLAPAIARKFGRDAIATVEKAEDVLAGGNVTGTDVGSEIENSQSRSAILQA